MGLKRILIHTTFLFFLILAGFSSEPNAHASEGIGSDASFAKDLNDFAGHYKGEVRLQNSDGTIDTLLVPDAQIYLEVQKDQLVVRTPNSFMGKYCQSEIGGVRELMKGTLNPTQLFQAVFDYDSAHCPQQKKSNAIVLYLGHELDGSLVLETLLTQSPVNLAGRPSLNQKLNVHGFFTKN